MKTVTAIIVKFFFSEQGKKTIAFGIGGLAFLIMIPVILITSSNPWLDNNANDPYKTALIEIMRDKEIKSSKVSPTVIKTIELILYEDISKRQVAEIKSDLILYYLKEEKKQQEVCSEVEDSSGVVYEQCETIETIEFTFKDLEGILNDLKTDKNLTDEQIEDIRLILELAKEGGYFEDELGSAIPIPTSGGFILPTANGMVTCSYGCYEGHIGTDIGSYSGTEILVVADGVVIESYDGCVEGNTSCGGKYGNHVAVAHNIDGTMIVTLYAHMLQGSVKVQVGDQIKQGTVLGGMGNTGLSLGTHLHIEMLVGINYFPGTKSERIKYVVDTETVFSYPTSW